MPRNIFVTGLPKSGKTTLLQRLVDELKKRGRKVGGFLSPARLEHGTREGFYVCDVETGKTAQLASLSSGGPKVGKYCVKVKEFESVALPAMNKVDKYDVFVIDEIGRMEMKSKNFTNLLDKVFESKTLVIASIADDYAPVYGFQGEIILLTPTNREGVYMELLQKAVETPLEKVKKAEILEAEAPRARVLKKKTAPKTKKKKEGRKKKKEKVKKKEEAPKAEKTVEKPMEEKAPKKAGEKKGIVGKIKDLLGF